MSHQHTLEEYNRRSLRRREREERRRKRVENRQLVDISSLREDYNLGRFVVTLDRPSEGQEHFSNLQEKGYAGSMNERKARS